MESSTAMPLPPACVTSSAAVVTVLPVGSGPSGFANIATRAYCSTANRVTIGGFVVSGSADKRVLVRAVGPTLTTQGIGAGEVLADPTIDVYRGSSIISSNDNWTENPNIAEINYQLAWTCDVLGREAQALPYYEKAIALGLPDNELAGALLGLGSTLRHLGQFERSASVLESARLQFPDNREFDAFLALTLHAGGKPAEALRLALDALCDTSEDQGIRAYQRAIRHAAS